MIRLPGPTEHCTVIGRTGTGKTTFAAWLLSKAAIWARPVVVFDGKYDPIFDRLDKAKAIRSTLRPDGAAPKAKGLHLVHPVPSDEDAIEGLLWRIWQRGNTMIYIDEMYLMPDKGALRAIFTQGRSKRLPVIALAQRPVDVSRYCFSEASYFACFDITDERDWKTIRSFCPVPDPFLPPPYHCMWYDVKRKEKYLLTPVPEAEIVPQIAERAPRGFW